MLATQSCSQPNPAVPAESRVLMIQDGARLHYGVPIALHRAGLLERMFTQYFAPPWSPARGMARVVGLWKRTTAARMADRFTPYIPRSLIVTNLWLGAREQLGRNRFSSGTEFYEWQAREVSRWVLRHGFGAANCLHGYIRNIDPSLIATAKTRGLHTVADQIIAPAEEELLQASRQQERWPGWQRPTSLDEARPYVAWEAASWRNLDRITCASDYVRDCLLRMGQDARRIRVLPYPIDITQYPEEPRGERPGLPVVGFVGAVNLRKGAPAFFEIARRLRDRARFVMVGPVHLEPQVVQLHSGRVEFVGAIPRSDIRTKLQQFDIFLFPSTCEGSAGAVMEAMAMGLPIVTTPNSGSVVRDGVDGFVFPYEDVDGLTWRVEWLLKSPDERLRMGVEARARAGAYNLTWYAEQLAGLYRDLMAETPA